MAKPEIKIITHSCADKNEAENLKKKWKSEVTEVKSAYKPSGKMPPKALWLMITGTVLGAPASALAGAAILAVGSIISGPLIKVLIWMLKAIKTSHFVPLFILIFIVFGILIAVVIATFGGMYTFAGMTAAGVVTQMGKLGKNRNTKVPMVLSVISAVAGAVTFWFVSAKVIASLDEGRVQEGLQFVFTFKGVGLVLFFVGLIFAALGAKYSRLLVLEAKFCEQCEQYIAKNELGLVTFENAKELVKKLNSGNIADIPNLITPKEKGEGTVTLFSCSRCFNGFLEASLTFSAKWVNIVIGQKQEENLTESWLVASRSLSESEVRLFEALKKT